MTQMKYAILGLGVLAALLLAAPIQAFAAPQAPQYALQISPNPVPNLSTLTSAFASTDDSKVTAVFFEWVGPAGLAFTSEDTAPTACSTFAGCMQFLSQFTPNLAGEWTITAAFCTNAACLAPKQVHAVFFVNVIVLPEYPLGAILAVAAPVVALIGFTRFRKEPKEVPVAASPIF